MDASQSFADETLGGVLHDYGFTTADGITSCQADVLGPDRVYRVSVPAGSDLDLTLTAYAAGIAWDPVIYVIRGPASNCGDPAHIAACHDVNGESMDEELFVSGLGGTEVFVVVSSVAADALPQSHYGLQINLTQ